MAVFLNLATGCGLCLIMVWAVAAVRTGRVLYWPAVIGIAATLLARMGDGFMLPTVDLVLRWGGLVLAALVLIVDLLTEEVPIADEVRAAPTGAGPTPPI